MRIYLMPYPNFADKHLHEALFNPGDFIKYNDYKGKFPKKYIITYQKHTLNYFLRKYKPKKHKSWTNMYVYKDIGFVRMKGIGAPHATVIFEEIIALGGRTFLNVGTAGGLNHEGVFLCEKAIRDEGTSYHYIPHGEEVFPDKKLTEKFGKCIRNQGIEFFRGTTWTIDAPYRETRAEIEHYVKHGVSTVEMEASALFAVAKVRKVKIASAFVVSDILGKKWKPQFHKLDIKRAQNKLIDAAVECLS